jgi:TorA maturation chaperone TorD
MREVTVDIKDFIVREKARCDSFKLMAACFYQPQLNVFQEERLLNNLVETLKMVCLSASVDAGNMTIALNMHSEEELLIDYAKLFVGPNELLAAPYGSIYLEKDRRVMGDSTMEVIEFYKSHGLVMDEDFKEVPDHIAVELEFMYYLIFKEIEAIEKSDMASAIATIEAQEFFMNKFLRSWADKLAEKIIKHAETSFYRALAGCLSSFINKTEIQDSLPEELKAAAISYSA